jgi:cytochrome c oxidase assembly protein subunit 15
LQVALGVLTLKLQLQAPLVTIGHQLTAALLVGLLAAVLARCLGSPGKAVSSARLAPEVIHG